MSDAGAIGLKDFEMLRVIGRGSYAKVLLVEQKSSKRVYAMKVIKKELVNDDEVMLHFAQLPALAELKLLYDHFWLLVWLSLPAPWRAVDIPWIYIYV